MVLPGFSIRHAPHQAIAIFDSTPVYIQELVEIVNSSMTPPASADPEAKILIDSAKMSVASDRLARMLGMIAEAGYVEGLDFAWSGAVIFGTRFIYYHELGHLSHSLQSDSLPAVALYPEEEDIAEEILADQFALSMLTLELRNQPELHAVAYSGIAFAIMLVAVQEFSETDASDGTRSLRKATLRFSRLRHWAQLGVDLGAVEPAAPRVMQSYWDLFTDLLRAIDHVPSPVFSLLAQTAQQNRTEWTLARNHFVRWCAFGDCKKLRSTLSNVQALARQQADHQQRASDVLRVIEYILQETAGLEPDLGFAELLRTAN